MYDAILARSFGKHEHKQFGVCAFVGCFIMTFGICIIMSYNFSPLLTLNWQLTRSINSTLLSSTAVVVDDSTTTESDQQSSVDHELQQHKAIKRFKPSLPPSICNFSEPRSDFCEINTDTRIQGTSSTIFFFNSLLNVSNTTHDPNNKNMTTTTASWSIKPYARKTDRSLMKQVKEWSLKPANSIQQLPHCTKTENIPAIVFSLGAYTGNHFHDFSDVIVPLYITSREFNGQVQFLVSNYKTWWFKKFRILLKSLSSYDVIDVDHDPREVIRCFPKTIIGLKSYKELSIDPSKSPNGYSMRNFTQFLRKSYSLKRSDTLLHHHPLIIRTKPRLLIVSRKKSRAFLNEDELAAEARSLGYDVVIADASMNLARFSVMVNSFDVFMGVHGAGLTNSVFLPENAVLIQVIPLGLEWLAKTDFELPARDMNLRYLEYRISKNESSLIQKYGVDHPVLKDPSLVKKQGWNAFRSVYLVSQNVRLDVNRFRDTLLKALELLRVSN